MDLTDFLDLAIILVATAVILVVLLQSRGGGVGEMFGGGSGGGSGYRTRRGVERALFQLTILLITTFVVLSGFAVRAHA
ncbi:MAG: preprotein translocase subunit SecG [Dehalococcoidia bacterium]|nr:preprotein translocase subunit SecG [Dehalococcoidia bacterium]